MSDVGCFALVLHAHLPYVLSHGTWPHGTDWLNEAASVTYIPLLNVFNRLVGEGVSPKVTVGLTPVLSEMLSNRDFKGQFKDYLLQKKKAAEDDIEEFVGLGQVDHQKLAKMWVEFYSARYDEFTSTYGEDITGAYRALQDQGHIEIITCSATHAYLPLLGEDTSIQAQVKQGIASYKRHYGRAPRGIWLPECAYRPSYKWARPEDGDEPNEPVMRKGVEEFLSENNIEYFFVDSHLIKGGKAIGVYLDRFDDLKTMWERFDEQYQPLPETAERTPYKVYWAGSAATGKKPVAVFSRDPITGLQVWSGEWGYPADANYLDFHKKKFPGGHKYWCVTDSKADLADKKLYHPETVSGRIPENAAHFKDIIKQTLASHLESTGEPGIVVSPYDAELFGHWWFEGPEWLYQVIKFLHDDGSVRRVTTGEYLDIKKPREVVALPEGSWGEGGYHWIWLNDMNKWSWRLVYEAERELSELVGLYFAGGGDAEFEQILKQAARELMLLQSSDWPFLISTRAASDYAEKRIKGHYDDFSRLAKMARDKAATRKIEKDDRDFLKLTSARDNIFPDMDLSWYKEVEFAAKGA